VVLLAACGFAGLAGLYVVACIPDLPDLPDLPGLPDFPPDSDGGANDASTPQPPTPVEGSSPESAPPPQRCGDGFIELRLGEQCDPGKALLGDAGTAFCSASCQMICPDGGFMWSLNNHCYTLSGEATSLVEAGALCAPGGHVVTFVSDDEFNAVTGALGRSDDAGAYFFWVGMRAHQIGDNHYDSVVLPRYEPGWSPDCSGCYARADYDAGDFAHGDAGIGGDCVRSRASPSAAVWDKYACVDAPKLRVICEHEPEEMQLLPAKGLYYFSLRSTYPTKTYVYDPTPTTEAKAEATCVSHKGRLVVLQSRDERDELWDQLTHTTETHVWIGLATSDGGWAWGDGTPSDDPDAYPSEWAIGEPSEGGTRRAYLALTNIRPVDTTLAHTNLQLLPPDPGVVCQFP
jgi:hypothetical protein